MIKGENIYLRPILKEDIKLLNDWKNDEETFKYLGGGFQPISIDQQVNWLDSMIDLTGSSKRFIISDYDESAIGMIGLYSINWIHRTCEIGVYIGVKQSKGKGFGKESVQLIEQYAKNYLNIRKIKLNVVLHNDIALNMWSSLGYQSVGTLSKERFIDGKYYDLGIMEKFL